MSLKYFKAFTLGQISQIKFLFSSIISFIFFSILIKSSGVKIFPDSRNTKHNLALIYDIKNEWEKSDQLYLELIDSDSLDAQAFNNYAYSLVERNENIEFALELSKSAISISPTSAPYLDTIGWIYFNS